MASRPMTHVGVIGAGRIGKIHAEQVVSAKPLLFFLERYRESFIAEMAAFIACVQRGDPPPVGGYDARKPVVIGLAAQRSYREGRPVRLSEIEDEARHTRPHGQAASEEDYGRLAG